MATAFKQVKNRATSTLNGAMDGSTDPVTFNVQGGEGANFPAPGNGFWITIDSEILLVTARTADQMTADRAQCGTSIATHSNGADVQLRILADHFDDATYGAYTRIAYLEDNAAILSQAETITAKWTFTLTSGTHLARRIGGDTQDRSYWDEAKIAWGTGAVAADTQIGRGGANLLSSPDNLELGTNPAQSGLIRIPNAQMLVGRNAANLADVNMMRVNAGRDRPELQAPIDVLRAATGVLIYGWVTGDAQPRFQIQNHQVDWGDGAFAVDTSIGRGAAGVVDVQTAMRFGTNPAAAGTLRLPNNEWLNARNAANGADIGMWRVSASDELETTTKMEQFLAAGTVVLEGYVAAEANPKVSIEHAKIQFGAGGGAAVDVNLYRGGANILQSDDAFRDDLGLFVGVAPTTTDLVRAYKVFTDTSGTLSGGWFEARHGPAGASTATIIGVRALAYHTTANPPGNHVYGGLYSAVHAGNTAVLPRASGARFDVEVSGSTDITEGRGVEIRFNRSAGANDVVTARGIYIYDAIGGMAPTTMCGIYLAAFTSGATNNFSIQSLGGIMRHVGAINIGSDADPATSALLELESTTGALLLSRMTTAQKNALTAVDGMMVHDSSLHRTEIYDGSWAGRVGYLEGWVTDSSINPTIGSLPANAFPYRVDIWIEEQFDDSGTDLLTVGYDADTDAYVTSYDVGAAAGTREMINENHANAGATLGIVDATGRSVELYYTGQNADATAGKAFVVVYFIIATAEPA